MKNLFKEFLSKFIKESYSFFSMNSVDKITLKEEIKHLSVLHISVAKSNQPLLKNISFGIDRGESLALVGDSTSGKSFIRDLLLSLSTSSEGAIVINDKYNIKDINIKSLEKKITYFNYQENLFTNTIAKHITYTQEFNKAKVKEALKKVHLWKFVEELNNGIDTMLIQKGKQLSELQKQQLTLAHLLYKEPDVLIIDEMNSSLHPKEEALIQRILKELKSELITITVTEKLNNIKNFDAILVFKEGQIICRGQHEDLIHECEEYQKLAKVLI
jgi:subfamily B ATP-binding cassette protein MsbA